MNHTLDVIARLSRHEQLWCRALVLVQLIKKAAASLSSMRIITRGLSLHCAQVRLPFFPFPFPFPSPNTDSLTSVRVSFGAIGTTIIDVYFAVTDVNIIPFAGCCSVVGEQHWQQVQGA
jgi:hypothetical protein